MSINIQRAILATFLWSNDMDINTDDAFLLDLSLFTDDRKLIASKINEVTDTEDRFYGILNMELENTSPDEWLAISEQTPLIFSYINQCHKKLHDTYNNNILRGIYR